MSHRNLCGILFCLCACFLSGCAAMTSNSENAASESGRTVQKDVSGSSVISQLVSNDDKVRNSQANADLMLFESWPQETTLDNAHIADVVPVWIEAIDSAQKTLDFEEYYVTYEPNTGLDKVIKALKRAGERGVKIRFIIDSQMSGDYPSEILTEIPNLELRVINFNQMTGGIQHSKFFIVDGKTLYFGSQNFDWRSLEQISEMGARLRPANLVEPIKEIFELDWELSQNVSTQIASKSCRGAVDIQYKGEKMKVESVASPKDYLPCPDMWDLPKLVAMIQNAKSTVAVQLLNYATVNYDKTEFKELDDALIAAAGRGVKVRLLVSDWSTRPKYMADLKRLAQIDNIETRMIEVPEHSSGFVPYSRTIHSKFMVVDKDQSWVGTSNWAGDYFYKSRNIGIIAESQKLNQDLTKSFDHYWNSSYAIPVDPNVEYKVKNQAKKE